MNDLVKAPLEGDVLGPEAAVAVTVRESVFSHRVRSLALVEGFSLAEIITMAGVRGNPSVHIGASGPIPRAVWPRVRPKAGASVVIIGVPAGKGLLKAAVALAAIAVAMFAGPWVAGLFFTAGTTAFAVTSAIVTAGITIGAQLALQRLFPVKKPAQQQRELLAAGESAPQRFAIAGSQNQARPFEPLPLVLGTHRIAPPFLARPFTENVGPDQYVRLAVCWGVGALDVWDVKIGETPIAEFGAVEISTQVVDGGETALSHYQYDTAQLDLQIQLGGLQSYIQRTLEECSFIHVDLTAPQGIYKAYTGSNNALAFDSVPTPFLVEARKVGSSDWVHLATGQLSYDRATARLTLGGSVLETAQYDVRVTRTAAEVGGDQTQETVIWTALRSWRPRYVMNFPAPVTVSSLRILATGRLNGVVDTLNATAATRVLAFNGTEWVLNRLSSNPADLFRHVLQGPQMARPVASELIDLPQLEAWWRFCNERGYTFNHVVEQAASVTDLLESIASAGRASVDRTDGLWSVVWDRHDQPVTQMFTPRNAANISFTRGYERQGADTHALRVAFINREKGWKTDERIVYRDGYDASTATRYERIELTGIDTPALVYKHARYRMAQVALRPETATLTTALEHLACRRGDRVRLQHDAILVGQVSGRITAVDGGTLTLDETVMMVDGRSYGIEVRSAANGVFTRTVMTSAGETAVLTLDGAGLVPEPGDLFAFGESGKATSDWRVSGIRPRADLTAELTLTNDAPALESADSGPIPEFESSITAPVDWYQVVPEDLQAVERVDGESGASGVSVRFSWRVPRQGRVVVYEAEMRDHRFGDDATWTNRATVSKDQPWVDFPGLLIGDYSFRVRAVYDNGVISAWVVLNRSAITGVFLRSPLPNVTRLRTAFVDGVLKIDFDEVPDYRRVAYIIRQGATWDSALTVGEIAHPPFAVPNNGSYLIKARSRPLSGIEVWSPDAAAIEVAGHVLERNVVATFDEVDEGWDGTFEGSVAVSGDTIRTGGSGDILTAPDVLAIPDILTYGGAGEGYYTIPAERFLDVGRVAPCAVSITLAISGEVVGWDVYSIPDVYAIEDIYGTSATAQVEGWVEISTATNDDDDVYAVDDIYAMPDVYAGTVLWGEWKRFTPGVYNARHFRFRVRLKSFVDEVQAVCTAFSWRVDAPDRTDNYRDVAVSATTGAAIVFQPDGVGVDPAPFNGGPNGSPYPYVSAAILAAQSGDEVELTDMSVSGVTIKIKNGASYVARTVHVIAQGY